MLYETLHLGLDWRPSGSGYYWVGTGLGCGLIIWVSLASRRIQAALHLPPLVFLGRISYSVYLLQFIVILCVLPPWIHFLNALGIYRALWLLPLNFIASISVTVGLSTLAFHLVEKPCIRLGQVLSAKWQEVFSKPDVRADRR
jgi:peptidoglycan/LPS O-acetylase OafA/YrhL